MSSLLLFVTLQIGDLLTTLFFLRHGVGEANPLVRAALGSFTHPAIPLILVKAGGCALALVACRAGRGRALRTANLVFLFCVAWNLLAVALS